MGNAPIRRPAAAAGFTAPLCFLSYHYEVQRTCVSVFLNGGRFDLDWPWRDAQR